MQSNQHRSLILIAVLLGGWGLLLASQRVQAAEVRYPVEDALFSVPGWVATPAHVENPNWETHIVSRRYLNGARDTIATFILKVDPESKNVYRIGAGLGFTGAGYAVAPAPDGLVPPGPGREALVATRGTERVLLVYAYGEERGLVGNGLSAWGLAALDAMVGRPNNYYQLSIQTRLDDLDPAKAAAVAALADVLFPQVAAWYAN